jgi:asparaginyl-tRNA synthetase
MSLAEECLKSMASHAKEKCGEDVAYLRSLEENPSQTAWDDSVVINGPYARMTYTEALAVLQDAARSGAKQWVYAPVWGEGLALEHEKFLAEAVVKGPVFVTNYPAAIKAFYARRSPETGERGEDPRATVQAFDLLVPGVGELVGGSAREDDYLALAKRMRALGLLSPAAAARIDEPGAGMSSGSADLDAPYLDWYLDLRKYGSVPHAGWGMGFERLILYLTRLDNVRDVIPIPRVPGSCRM